MLIATFNETTGWSGKTIDFENDVFTLEGVGPLTAADVLSYDNQGYLEWANDGTRAWVQSKVEAPQVQGAATTSAPAESRLTSVWAKVTASAGAVSVAAGNAAQTAKVAYAGARDAMKEQRGGAPGQTEESTPVAESADEHTEAAAPAEPADHPAPGRPTAAASADPAAPEPRIEPPTPAPPYTAPAAPTVSASQPDSIPEAAAPGPPLPVEPLTASPESVASSIDSPQTNTADEEANTATGEEADADCVAPPRAVEDGGRGHTMRSSLAGQTQALGELPGAAKARVTEQGGTASTGDGPQTQVLVATFNPTTGWAGKTITFDGKTFTLDDHGPITAPDVMEYDRQGHLEWPNDRIRSWAEAKGAPPPETAADRLSTVTKSLRQPVASDVPGEASLERYEVVYRGGHPAYPKERIGGIVFSLFPDRFEFQPKSNAMWFVPMTIPYATVLNLEIVERQLSSFEGIFGGLNSRQLNQMNNIHISYEEGGQIVLLRLEMLSGVTVMGQAKKCRQFEDRLRNYKIREKFRQTEVQPGAAQQADDIPTQIEKLADLRDKGIISPAQFETKKSDLLSRM